MSDLPEGVVPRFLGWLADHRPDFAPADLELIEKASLYASQAHTGQVRKSGIPYEEHPFEVARILAENGMEAPLIAAGILHDVVEDTEITTADIEDQFGPEISFLVDGVTKIDALPSQSREHRQAETFRKMLLSMARDPRVILIKFADRLHNLRTLRYMKPERRKGIASETLEVYAPLAHRFGMGRIRWELEDLSFKHLHPEDYADLVEQISERRTERESAIRTIIEPLENRLADMGVNARVIGRPKHLYSIWKKLKEKGAKSIDQIHDLNAVRILTESVGDCYVALGMVHSTWPPVAGRFKDYIAVPKSNMYQSLHTTVMGGEGRRLEVQIRTVDMDRIASEGIAAHWAYKEKVTQVQVDSESRFLKQLVSWQKDAENPKEFLELVQGDLNPSEIFVYTPRGDVVQLPQGATPVDFAFEIHTGLGLHCAGARADGVMIPLHATLQPGQVVDVIRSESAHPTRDWLRLVKTSKARNGIRKWLRSAEAEANRNLGREILSRELARRRVEKLGEELTGVLLERFKLATIEELQERIGHGDVTVDQFSGLLPALPTTRKSVGMLGRMLRRKPPSEVRDAILVGGQGGIPYLRAGCCQPLPGEDIIGYVTQGRGISLHRKDCLEGKRLAGREGRFADVAWHENAGKDQWDVGIEVAARDRPNLLRDLTQALSSASAEIQRASIATVSGQVRDRFRVKVSNLEMLDAALRQLRSVNGVLAADRAKGGTK
jgi:GTP diphosphokinase / guanosine-3',5'-bis(diphosphate) 3'-diphosphatase